MKRLASGLGKAVVLWLALGVGMVLGGMLFFHGAPPASVRDGPFESAQVMLLDNAADTLVLVLLAGWMRTRGWRLGLLLAVVLFGVQTAQALIEAVAFNNDLHMSTATLISGGEVSLVRDALAGIAIAIMWRGPNGRLVQIGGLFWKAPAVACLYVACYIAAGYLIAWRSAEVRTFYAHVGQIDPLFLLGLQFVRGLIWCALAWLLVRNLSGPAWRTAGITGLAFSVFMALQLLYPNPVMPWPVRSAHLIEIGVSNFVFGVIAALILLAGVRTAEAER